MQWGANRRARRALLFLRYFAAGDGGGSGRRSLNSCSTINFARHSCLGRSFGSGRQDTSCCQAEKRVKKRRQHHFLGGNSDGCVELPIPWELQVMRVVSDLWNEATASTLS